ncbi:AAA family ATPase [Gulosibacter chungangensis]|uniref:AAA family ATPase n=1 Tax=Gulosibacter chungangensis TaxID=979746 RepID=A0A7J5BAQ0_9MICO|nr:AAA family ATPase [Gulosibacter chungangensis]
MDPALVLEGATPRLLDEWQLVPNLWNAVRGQVDERQEFGQFLLTGSTAPLADATRHTGAAKFAWVRMRPMQCTKQTTAQMM